MTLLRANLFYYPTIKNILDTFGDYFQELAFCCTWLVRVEKNQFLELKGLPGEMGQSTLSVKRLGFLDSTLRCETSR